MPWMWTDDVAARLCAAGLVDEAEVASLIERPVALAVPDGGEASVEEMLARATGEDG